MRFGKRVTGLLSAESQAGLETGDLSRQNRERRVRVVHPIRVQERAGL